MNPISRAKKSSFVLPNAITAVGLLFGLLVIFRMNMIEPGASGYETISSVALLLLFSALADFADGFVARWMRVQTQFGLLFDSLNDAITFGVAPAVIVLKTLSPEAKTLFSFWASAGAMTYCLCGVLRLVRYSVQKSTITFTQVSGEKYRFFTGLPIPAACCAVISLTLVLTSDLNVSLGLSFEKVRAPALIIAQIFLGILMVSRWKFPAVTQLSSLFHSRKIAFLGLGTVVLFWLYSYHPTLALLVVIWGYVLGSLTYGLFCWATGKKELALAERWQWWT